MLLSSPSGRDGSPEMEVAVSKNLPQEHDSARKPAHVQTTETPHRSNWGPSRQAIEDLVRDLRIELRALDSLKINPRNPRRHTDRQIGQLAESITAFGFLIPVIIDEHGKVVIGNGRVAAAGLLGLPFVPTVCVRHLTAAQRRALALADNRLAELSDWDPELLRLEIQELSEVSWDLDIEIPGFDTVDIDRILQGDAGKGTDDPADHLPVADPLPPVTRLGDRWELGPHRLVCGNALEGAAYDQLLGDERAQLVFTDPPYNVPIVGHVTGRASGHREFAMAVGEMSPAQFTTFLQTVLALMATYSANGSIQFVCMDWRHQRELLDAAASVYGAPKNVCVWVKSNGGMGSFYRSAYELIYVFKFGDAPHINNFGLGGRGRYRTNVWEYAGVNAFGRQRDDELRMHPTVKPTALVADAIRDCSRRGGIVLDPFAGSGTTLIAAERTGRVSRVMELDPRYCDVIVRRWEALTGKQATSPSHGGATFQEVSTRRTGDALQANQSPAIDSSPDAPRTPDANTSLRGS